MPVRDTREQPRHYFRPDSKKYMTVEMEQPFVWPEIPEDLTPWGKQERSRELENTVAVNPGSDQNQQRNAARQLRQQVVNLFRKKDSTRDRVTERKKKAGIELSQSEQKSEQKKEQERIEREKASRKTSRLDLWEKKRTGKAVEVETADRSKYTIKA
jgi:large subunit ribosomal protein L23